MSMNANVNIFYFLYFYNINISMRDLEFTITSYCQAKCPSCPRTDEDTLETHSWLKLEHMDVSVIEKIVSSNWWDPENTKIKICGETGDPLMHPKINHILEIFLQQNVNVRIATNGGLRNSDWYKFWAEKYDGKLCILFGIDGVDHDTNSKYRIGVDTDRAFKNMMSFHNAGGEAIWQFIAFEFNKHQIDEWNKQCLRHGLGRHFIVNTSPWYPVSDSERDKLQQWWEHEEQKQH
jgi:organic radical activating enzyme